MIARLTICMALMLGTAFPAMAQDYKPGATTMHSHAVVKKPRRHKASRRHTRRPIVPQTIYYPPQPLPSPPVVVVQAVHPAVQIGATVIHIVTWPFRAVNEAVQPAVPRSVIAPPDYSPLK